MWNFNKRYEDGHTHIKSKKRAREIIDCSIDKRFPLHWSNYFIESMIRLTEDKRFERQLRQLRETRKGKERYCYRRI